MQGLLKMGARKIAVVGLPPMGCVPAVITLNSDNAFTHRDCIQRLSSVARDYNRRLQMKLAAIQKHTSAATLIYVDIYNPIDAMVQNPQQFGNLSSSSPNQISIFPANLIIFFKNLNLDFYS